jgi:biopolymer transport protein ExbD
MKYVLEVCLIAFTAGTFAPSLRAQSPVMQKGISVDLTPTRNASPMPGADSKDAFIVAVTADGSVYLGVDPITLSELTEKARNTPLRSSQAIYIKADARTAYGAVLPVLRATRSAAMLPQVVLTSQSESTESGRIVPPEGFPVSVGSVFPSGTVATVVQLLASDQQLPLLKINNDEISWSAFVSTLRQHFQKGDDRVVLLRVDASLPFSDIVRAIDDCRAAGARVYLAEPEL